MSAGGGGGGPPLLLPAAEEEAGQELLRAWPPPWPRALLLALACGATLIAALSTRGTAAAGASALAVAPGRRAAPAALQLAEADACAGRAGVASISGVRYPYLTLEKVLHNNLGGHGPDGGPEGLVYECGYEGGLSGDGGRGVRLEVHAAGGYRPHSARMNGRSGQYGVINLAPGCKAPLRFRFADGAGAPLRLPALALTFLDLDEDGDGHGVEYLTVGGFDEFLLTEGSEVRTLPLPDGRTLFHASRRGSGGDNPFGDLPPTLAHQDRAIGLLYSNVNEVNVTLGVGNPGMLVRIFMFVSRPFPCTMTRRSGAARGGEEGAAARGRLGGVGRDELELQGGGAPLVPGEATGGGLADGKKERQMLSSGQSLPGHVWAEGSQEDAGSSAGASRPGLSWLAVLLLPAALCGVVAWFLSPNRRARAYTTLRQQLPSPGSELCSRPLGAVGSIASRQSGDFKWSGIVALGTQLYCVPFHADAVLLVDACTHAARAIACGESWNGKWNGAAAWQGDLYCAPFNADDVLVVDTATGSTRTIAAAGAGADAGDFKWAGIAALGERLYCAPHNAEGVLVIDPATGQTHTIATGQSGCGKWHGIAALGDKLYCAPFNADDVLVIDPVAETTELLPSGQRGGWKWAGIAALGDRLYCAPHDAEGVLVVDPATSSSWTIPTGRTGVWKWMGVAACGDALYCAPCCADDILVVHPAAGKTSGLATGRGGGGHKWAGVAAVGRRLYCAPSCADEVLEVSLGASAVAL